jgi:hypothetical protein
MLGVSIFLSLRLVDASSSGLALQRSGSARSSQDLARVLATSLGRHDMSVGGASFGMVAGSALTTGKLRAGLIALQ